MLDINWQHVKNRLDQRHLSTLDQRCLATSTWRRSYVARQILVQHVARKHPAWNHCWIQRWWCSGCPMNEFSTLDQRRLSSCCLMNVFPTLDQSRLSSGCPMNELPTLDQHGWSSGCPMNEFPTLDQRRLSGSPMNVFPTLDQRRWSSGFPMFLIIHSKYRQLLSRNKGLKIQNIPIGKLEVSTQIYHNKCYVSYKSKFTYSPFQ